MRLYVCEGEEEEVRIFIDLHVHLARIHTQILNSEQGYKKTQTGSSLFKILQVRGENKE